MERVVPGESMNKVISFRVCESGWARSPGTNQWGVFNAFYFLPLSEQRSSFHLLALSSMNETIRKVSVAQRKSNEKPIPWYLKPVSGEYTANGPQAIHSLFNPSKWRTKPLPNVDKQFGSSSTKNYHNKLYAKHQTSPENPIRDATSPHQSTIATSTHREK